MGTTTRAQWQGYITLGRLGVPVRLYAAIRSIRPRFVRIHEADGSTVERELRCQKERRKIDYSEVVRAIEYEPGKYITLTDNELDRNSALPTKTIGIRQFCETGTVPSIYFDRTFYVVPSRGGERAYALLREVLVRQHKVALAEFVIHIQEHIAMLDVYGDLLVLQQLHFASEIVPRVTLRTPALPKPSPAELEVLGAVVDRFSGPVYLEDYHDIHSEQINDLIERKARGSPRARREYIAPRTTDEARIIDALQDTLDEKRLAATAAGVSAETERAG